ncbi:hypothetical protein H9V85_004070 [Salmonella enterica subsp. enterica serovar Louisiana]|nr:hypothetical protein [Salmonella enterica subsp. enterica serovar Louisiana]ECD3929297.1 hypothetical protein [Salmonella enterica subsp. enterica serovar Wangata]EDW5003350.1 hypothetical protein [Salmonella enterica subsp. enterica serovar Isangi]EEE9141799.1 hypothetical protein [Salmonella enterica subsp. enterica serovar Plymouth]EHF9646574.1 hypothetical protein [Salmonella enterica]
MQLSKIVEARRKPVQLGQTSPAVHLFFQSMRVNSDEEPVLRFACNVLAVCSATAATSVTSSQGRTVSAEGNIDRNVPANMLGIFSLVDNQPRLSFKSQRTCGADDDQIGDGTSRPVG